MQIMTLLDPLFSMLAEKFREIIALFLAVTSVFGGGLAAPATDDPIKAVNPEEVQLTFTYLGDTQINAFNTNSQYLEALLQDLDNAETEQDAFMIVGDITENCLTWEWDTISSLLNEYDFGDRLLFATGNHDIRLRDYDESTGRFAACINSVTGEEYDSFIYSTEVNGYTFVVMGSDEEEMEEAYISEEQLEWVDETVAEATADGSPVFVVLHQPLKGSHGLPITWGNGSNANAGHVGEQSDAIYEVLNKYENVILLTGHLHTGFGEYNYDKIGNINSINVPGAGKDNKDGTYCEYGTGYSVEVYEDEVIFRARDFAKGKYLPEYDITVDLV